LEYFAFVGRFWDFELFEHSDIEVGQRVDFAEEDILDIDIVDFEQLALFDFEDSFADFDIDLVVDTFLIKKYS
jgi:hypothetical protein